MTRSTRSRKRRPRSEDSPFGYFGSPLPGLISLSALDRILNDEAMQALIEAAKIPHGEMELGRRTIARQEYFANAVRRTVRNWLKTADEPPVREFAAELVDLQRRLYDALSSGTDEACAQAAAAYANLSSAALDAIPDLGRPSAEQIRTGDSAALNQLFGLVPIRATPRLDVHPFAAGAEYEGPGAQERHQRGRPRDVRCEQLLVWLMADYERATGRPPGRGARSPFDHFFRLLLSFLGDSDLSEVGDQAMRRSVRARKSLM
jgi:hypothetical protein